MNIKSLSFMEIFDTLKTLLELVIIEKESERVIN